MRELRILKPVARLEDLTVLDPVVREIHRVLDAVLRPKALEDVLHGVPAGHPVHPVLVQIPIGTWTSAAILDLVPGAERAARLLVGVGVLAAAPAILTGWADWTRSHRQQQRVGLVHAAVNEIGTVLYAASWLARRSGDDGRGRVLSYAAFGLIGAGGYLGGHLAYRQALGANHAEAAPHHLPEGWHRLADLQSLPDGVAVRVEVGREPLLVLRRGDRVDVLANTGSHLGAPLDEGILTLDGDRATITDPWHGSVYDIGTGEVLRGPATAPQPHFDTRVTGVEVEVRGA